MDRNEQDIRLVRDCLAGNLDAFGLLVRRYERPILNLMFRNTGSQDTAADLAQSTFVKAYAKLEDFRQGKRFFSWLYAIGLNLLRDHYRAQGRSRERTVEDIEAFTRCEEGSDRAILDLENREQARWLLARLPVSYREALVLRFAEECSMEEIAQALGLSLSGAKMRVRRGLDMLRKALSEGESHA